MKYKKQVLTALSGLFLIIHSVQSKAQQQGPSSWQTIGNYISRYSITHKPYTLIFINNDSTFAQTGSPVKQRMENTFFEVYPKLAKTYNKKTLKTVTFIIDPNYDGVAATSDGIVRYNPKWMLKAPTDIDVVTHEVMHIVQDYGNTNGPGWLTEGIADYVRYKFGVDNAGANWKLPAYKTGQSYTNSYRITARFLAWIEKNYKADLVKNLDSALRMHTYTDDIWKQQTGKTLDELWNTYITNPTL
jgi:hypothetical protein